MVLTFEWKLELIVPAQFDQNLYKVASKSLCFLCHFRLRDHPFKTSACLRGGEVKNLPNLPTDSTKELPTVGG